MEALLLDSEDLVAEEIRAQIQGASQALILEQLRLDPDLQQALARLPEPPGACVCVLHACGVCLCTWCVCSAWGACMCASAYMCVCVYVARVCVCARVCSSAG